MPVSPELNRRLCDTLARCGPFESDKALRALFTDARIAFWHDDLPQAYSPAERVRLTVAFLIRRANTNNENGLILFLHVVSDQFDPGDACCRDLRELAGQMKDDIANAVPDGRQVAWYKYLGAFRAVVIVVGLLLGVSLIVKTFSSEIPPLANPSPTMTPPVAATLTPTIDITPTETPTATPTATPNAVPPATPTLSPDDWLSLAQTWSRITEKPFTQWEVGPIEEPTVRATREITDDGNLHFWMKADICQLRKSIPLLDAPTDCYISVTAKNFSETDSVNYGIIFRQDGYKGYYQFFIDEPEVAFRVRWLNVDEWIDIKYEKSTAIKIGESNQLTVIDYGDEIYFYINQKFVYSHTDTSALRGNVGVHVTTCQTATVEFSDFEIRVPQP